MRTGAVVDIVIRDIPIGQDASGFVSLTDMWEAAGRLPSKSPARWLRNPAAKALIAAFEEKAGQSGLNNNSPDNSSVYAEGRRGGETFAHPIVAIAYAGALDQQIAVEMHAVFLRVKANDVSLVSEILSNIFDQVEYDRLRLLLRDRLKDHNKLLSSIAKEAGVTDFKAFHGAGLVGLYDMHKSDLLKHKGLPAGGDHLDHANHEELAANYFKATQTAAKLRREEIKGQTEADSAHHAVGVAVRNTIKELGGVTPENEPALDHIKNAQKRLKAFKSDDGLKRIA
jgi:hypothetical protein